MRKLDDLLPPDRLVPGVIFKTALKDKKAVHWIVLRHILDFELTGTDGIPISNRLKNKVWARPLLPHNGCFCQPKIVCFDLIIDRKWVKLFIPRTSKECRAVCANLTDYDSEKYAEGEATHKFMDWEERRCYEVAKSSTQISA